MVSESKYIDHTVRFTMLIFPNPSPNLSYRAPAMRPIWRVFDEMNHRAS